VTQAASQTNSPLRKSAPSPSVSVVSGNAKRMMNGQMRALSTPRTAAAARAEPVPPARETPGRKAAPSQRPTALIAHVTRRRLATCDVPEVRERRSTGFALLTHAPLDASRRQV
jgi:hypothetical protein